MRLKRKLKFKLEYTYVSGDGLDATFSKLSDGTIISDCYEICSRTNCEFIKMKSPWSDERKLIIKGTKRNFITFVKEFTSENSKYIDNIKF